MYIVKKVRLVAGPEPVWPVIPEGNGTFMVVDATQSRTFGMCYVAPLDGAGSFVVDWGDGTSERFVNEATNITHTYATGGGYLVTLSDTVGAFAVSDNDGSEYQTVYAAMVRELVSRGSLEKIYASGFRDAFNLTRLDLSQTAMDQITAGAFNSCRSLTSLAGLPTTIQRILKAGFAGCTSVTERVDLPNVTRVVGSGEDYQPFAHCDKIAEIHFGAANEALIKQTASWAADPKLGAANAVVYFDL